MDSVGELINIILNLILNSLVILVFVSLSVRSLGVLVSARLKHVIDSSNVVLGLSGVLVEDFEQKVKQVVKTLEEPYKADECGSRYSPLIICRLHTK